MRELNYPTGGIAELTEPTHSAAENLPKLLSELVEEYRPSRMPFFKHLAGLPRNVVSDPVLLGQIHLIYQSAMHATRAAVYYLPHLDSPALRKRKLQVFIDDDGLAGGDTHHDQLTRAFLSLGAKVLLDEEEFGEPGELCHYLEAETAHFVRLAPKLYARSLGPWCVIEMMSVDWMRALADALSVHFPHFKDEPYFAECFSQQVEERHAAEAVEVTQMVLRARPELLHEILRDARLTAEALNGVWTQLDRVVQRARAEISPRRGSAAERDRNAEISTRPAGDTASALSSTPLKAARSPARGTSASRPSTPRHQDARNRCRQR